jgi:HK97 gp10 family phage protein
VELPAKVGLAIHKGASDIAEACRERVPVGEAAPHLRDSIEVTETGPQSAGISMAFYWYFLEYGTTKMGARPFVRPSIESSYGQLYADVQEALRTL